MAYIAERCTGFHNPDAAPHGFKRHVDDALHFDAGLADREHPAGVAVPAVDDDGDIDVDGIAVLETFVTGDAVTNNVVDRCTDGFRKSPVT